MNDKVDCCIKPNCGKLPTRTMEHPRTTPRKPLETVRRALAETNSDTSWSVWQKRRKKRNKVTSSQVESETHVWAASLSKPRSIPREAIATTTSANDSVTTKTTTGTTTTTNEKTSGVPLPLPHLQTMTFNDKQEKENKNTRTHKEEIGEGMGPQATEIGFIVAKENRTPTKASPLLCFTQTRNTLTKAQLEAMVPSHPSFAQTKRKSKKDKKKQHQQSSGSNASVVGFFV